MHCVVHADAVPLRVSRRPGVDRRSVPRRRRRFHRLLPRRLRRHLARRPGAAPGRRRDRRRRTPPRHRPEVHEQLSLRPDASAVESHRRRDLLAPIVAKPHPARLQLQPRRRLPSAAAADVLSGEREAPRQRREGPPHVRLELERLSGLRRLPRRQRQRLRRLREGRVQLRKPRGGERRRWTGAVEARIELHGGASPEGRRGGGGGIDAGGERDDEAHPDYGLEEANPKP